MAKIIVVDDERSNREAVRRVLQRAGHDVLLAEDGEVGLNLLREEKPHLLITDLKMPKLHGIELLKEAKKIHRDLDVIVMSAYGSVESAVDAMKEGAWDFISKPLHRDELLHSVRTVIEKQDIHQENQELKEKIASLTKDDWIGMSSVMQRLTEEATQVADSLASVFLVGESGTGKGKLAKWIHKNSPHKNQPFITLNCGAIPETLIESELFGHEKGAFTGAQARRLGKFEQAQQGTLFLDEITEMPIHLQVKLLRVLQEGEFERVGGNQTIHIQTRVIAATNQEPYVAIQQGKLREDLYYRLNVIQMKLPPLRERKEDIPLLVRHFMERLSQKNNRPLKTVSESAFLVLQDWHWPGNVRELENVVERAVVLSRTQEIEVQDLPLSIREDIPTGDYVRFAIGTPLHVVEKTIIQATLHLVEGDKVKAAEMLGITARTIYRKEAEWLAQKEK